MRKFEGPPQFIPEEFIPEEKISSVEKTKPEIPEYLKPYLTPEQLAGKHVILREQFEKAKEALLKKDPLLRETIYDEEKKEERARKFEQVWQERWRPRGVHEGYFQTEENESPFSQYSSKGWKIHIAFEKGQEKEVARFLYKNGLYFKLEAGPGTFFNGLKESGATIYIGSYDNMQEITRVIEANIGKFLSDGVTAKAGDKIIHVGSGSDIEVRPKITARFDVAKTEFGWLKGNKKYGEYGLPTWTGLGGIPILSKYEKEVADIVSKWNKYNPYQRDLYYERRLKPIYEESKEELIRDFGEEFLFGKEFASKPK